MIINQKKKETLGNFKHKNNAIFGILTTLLLVILLNIKNISGLRLYVDLSKKHIDVQSLLVGNLLIFCN